MKIEKLCLMVPTFGRARTSFSLFMKTAYNMAESAICFCVCINKRDAETKKVLTETKWPEDMELDIIEEDTIVPDLAYYFNLMYGKTKFNARYIAASMLGDDMEFVTKGYDKIIIDRMNKFNGMGVFYCDDDYISHDICPVNMFVSRDFVSATRVPFMCPFFKADMIDVVWGKVGDLTGTSHYIPEVIIRHNHNSRSQERSWDKTYRRLRPLQISANTPVQQKAGIVYATVAANNLISAGIGRWTE